MPIETLLEKEGISLKYNPVSEAYVINTKGHVTVYNNKTFPKGITKLKEYFNEEEIKSKLNGSYPKGL